MPATGPGDKPLRPRRVRRKSAPNQTAAAAENQRQVATGKIRPPRPSRPISAPKPSNKPPAFKPPQGDTKSDADLGRAKDYKKTPGYRQAIRDAYDSLTQEQKRKALRTATTKDSVEARTIRKLHNDRVTRNDEIAKGQAQHDVVTDADLGRAKRFMDSGKFKSLLEESKPKQKASDIYLTDPAALKAAGFHADKAEQYAQLPGKVLPAAALATKEVIKATAEDPKAVGKNTAKAIPGTIAAIPAGLVATGGAVVTGHPGKVVSEISKDYDRRYGDLFKGEAGKKRFRERVKKEGALPEAIDIGGLAAGAVGGVGKGVGIVARSETVAKVAERGGAVGKAAKAVRSPVTKARPKLRKTAGARGAVEQDLSPNYLKALAQKNTDRRRAKKFEKRASQAETNESTVRGLVPEEGEVVRKSLRAQRRDQRVAVSTDAGRGFLKLKRVQDKEIRQGVEAERRDLNGTEKRVETLALQGLINFNSAAKTRDLLTAYRERIVAARKARTDRLGPKKILKKSDELRRVDEVLDLLDKSPEKVLTDNLRSYHEKQVDRYHNLRADDQTVDDLTAEVRRHQPVGRVLGEADQLDNELAQLDDATTLHKQRVKAADAQVQRTGRKVLRAKVREARVQGGAEVKVAQADRKLLRQDNEYKDATKVLGQAQTEMRDAKKAHGNAQRNEGLYSREERHAIENRAAEAERTLTDARANFKTVEAKVTTKLSKAVRNDDGKVVPPVLNRKPVGKLRKLERESSEVARRQVEHEAAKAKRAALRRPTEAELETRRNQAREAFVGRVKKRIADEGLPEPVYVGHRPRQTTDFGAYAIGAHKGARDTKHSEFKLFDEGRADTTGSAYTDSLAQSIKRNVNWNTVSDLFAKHTPGWGRNRTIEELRQELDDRGLDHRDWSFVDMARFRQARKDAEGSREGSDDFAPTGHQGIHDTVTHATYDLSGAEADFKGTARKLSIVPKGVADELEAMAKPMGMGGRTAQKVQGLQSKLILGTSPTFVPVQTAANTPLAALAIKNPLEWFKGHKAWKQLDDKTKEYLSDYLGMSVSASSSFRPRYGSVLPEDSNLVARFKEITQDRPIEVRGRVLVKRHQESRANPLNWNHRLDDIQNNWFRRQVFKAEMGRDAKRIAEQMDRTKRDIDPITEVLSMPDGPDKIAALRKAEPQIERAAENVDAMLGNYTRFTAKERKLARTTILFYPFLRWALKFTFYTLPVKHPVAAGIAAKLGELHREEVVDLLSDEIVKANKGVDKQTASEYVRNNTPAYAYGRIYYGSGDKLQSIDFGRVNPLATQAFDILPQPGEGTVHSAFRGFFGSASPMFMSALKAGQGRDPITQQPLNVGEIKTGLGDTADMTAGRDFAVVGHDVAELNPILRQIAKSKTQGKMEGDDFIPFLNENTVKYGLSDTAKKRITKKGEAQGGTKEQVADAVIPFRKKGDQTPDSTYRTAIFRELRKIKAQKVRINDHNSARYKELTKRETELKRSIGAIPPKKGRVRKQPALGSGLGDGLGGGLGGGLG